jgi:hypothetical protein
MKEWLPILSPLVAAIGWFVVYRLNLNANRRTRKASQVDAAAKLARDVVRAAVSALSKRGDAPELPLAVFQIGVDVRSLGKDVRALFDGQIPSAVQDAEIRLRQKATAEHLIDPSRAAADPNHPSVIELLDAGDALETAIRTSARMRHKIEV